MGIEEILHIEMVSTQLARETDILTCSGAGGKPVFEGTFIEEKSFAQDCDKKISDNTIDRLHLTRNTIIHFLKTNNFHNIIFRRFQQWIAF